MEGTHGSWVPGSPIDWAAMIPTASPHETVPTMQDLNRHLAHTPCFALQVSTERILIFSTLYLLTRRSASLSPIEVSFETTTSQFRDQQNSLQESVRQVSQPTARLTPLPSRISLTVKPSVVPQSSERIMTSCATSTKRRVRYPESAVREAPCRQDPAPRRQ